MTATRDDLFAFLERLGITTRTAEHAPVFTVDEARALRGAIPGAHSKNLFLKDKKGGVFLVVALEDADIDLKRLHTAIGASGRLSFGNAERLMACLGVAPGSVTPFAVLSDTEGRVTVVLDAALMTHDTLNFHPLENGATTSIARDDLVRFLEATGHAPLITPLPARAGEGVG